MRSWVSIPQGGAEDCHELQSRNEHLTQQCSSRDTGIYKEVFHTCMTPKQSQHSTHSWEDPTWHTAQIPALHSNATREPLHTKVVTEVMQGYSQEGMIHFPCLWTVTHGGAGRSNHILCYQRGHLLCPPSVTANNWERFLCGFSKSEG